jgi:hypothetical protein
MAHESDPVSAELRRIEEVVDNHYRQNLLVNRTLADSVWHFMTYWEKGSLFPMFGSFVSEPDSTMSIDERINRAKNPLIWLWKACRRQGHVPTHIDQSAYEAAHELFQLSTEYAAFENAYTYASRGWIRLKLEGSTIVASDDIRVDAPYEVYDRTISIPDTDSHDSLPEHTELLTGLSQSLEISGDELRYRRDPRFIDLALRILQPQYALQISLPGSWEFGSYSLAQYTQVWQVLAAVAYVHLAACRLAAIQAHDRGSARDCLLVISRQELVDQITAHSQVKRSAIRALVDDLTYGNAEIEKPDPAIQPLLALENRSFTIAPSLVCHSNFERNFCVLLNKIPDRRRIYFDYVNLKEEIMRQAICDRLPGLRFFHGQIPGFSDLPDIDLAIISDDEQACLIAELKWFIEPAEAREVIEKSGEIKKGIRQLIKIKNMDENNIDILRKNIGIDNNYRIGYAVVSANSVGHGAVQDPRIPVIAQSHLVKELASSCSLISTLNWLEERGYLPLEGKDYRLVDQIAQVGEWQLKWYGIQILHP